MQVLDIKHASEFNMQVLEVKYVRYISNKRHKSMRQTYS